ncbi:MAG: F0F1 ATP synthase subunit A [Terracidiphilus sp.]
MPDTLALTRWLNEIFGGVVASVLHTLGISANPATAINDTFTIELLVTLLLLAFFVAVRLSLSVENPNPAQHIAEMIHSFVGEQSEQVIGHGYERFQAYVTCVGLFVLLVNLAGLIPGITTPSSFPVVTLGVAIPTFFYYNYHGIRANGFLGFLRSFAGPVWWMAWLIFPIEVVSNLARILSLTVRLYANMFASDMMTLVAFSGFPVGLPVLALGLHFFVSLIQAFVFMLLTMIYLSLAVAHEH